MINHNAFVNWRLKRSKELEENLSFQTSSLVWLNEAVKNDYSYMFQWMGVPVIQFPSDVFLIQEAIFRSRANKVIEVGIARGGMTLFLASLLKVQFSDSDAKVVAVDVSVSDHTRDAISSSNVQSYIQLVEGNSISEVTLRNVSKHIHPQDNVVVILDSHHTFEHVYEEMCMYSPLVTKNSFMIVMDTAIEYLDPEVISPKKEWKRDNSPFTAILEYVKNFPDQFVLDEEINSRSMPGAARGGFLRKK